MDNFEDKAVDWAILAGAFIVILVAIASPVILYLEGCPISHWSLDSWELYLASLTVGMYSIIALIIWNIRKDKTEDDET